MVSNEQFEKENQLEKPTQRTTIESLIGALQDITNKMPNPPLKQQKTWKRKAREAAAGEKNTGRVEVELQKSKAGAKNMMDIDVTIVASKRRESIPREISAEAVE